MGPITITTYAELSDFVRAFGENRLNMLVVCSRGGLGKTSQAKQALSGRDPVIIGGHVTSLKLYEMLFRGRDKLILINETDDLLSVPANVGLMKQLCETEELKRIDWTSTDRRALEIDGGIGHFYTSSHVLILCNSFAALSANFAALRSRAIVVEFVPTAAEILSKIRTYALDKEIIALLEDIHESLPVFNLRTYETLSELKDAGLDWRRYALDTTAVPPKVKEIADLLAQYENDGQRLRHYSSSRRDFYNWKPQAVAYARRCSAAATVGIDSKSGRQPEENGLGAISTELTAAQG